MWSPRGECCADLVLDDYLLSQSASRRLDHRHYFSFETSGGLRFQSGGTSALRLWCRAPASQNQPVIDDSSSATTLNLTQVKIGSLDVRFGSWSCRNPRGLGHQRSIKLAKLTPIGFDYALIAAISG